MADRIMLSNVIGAPFDRYVLAQLYQRAARNSTISRSTEEILFLANKMAWVRMISSVNVALPNYDTFVGPQQPGHTPITAKNTNLGKFYQSLGIEDLSNYPDGTSLAKRWVLEAGTSITNGKGIDLRAGLGGEGAYGMGGIEEQGYRPMPGLTSVTIETAGRLGSLRIANVNFKVWNMNQLNTIEALYFRLGYSMLLEWGHVQYFKNDGVFETKNIHGINDPFRANLRKEAVQQEIAIRSKDADGNYDGMLGIVSNFTWSFNQEGGYDCNVKLIGLGSIMDSLRINQVYKLPDGLIQGLKVSQNVLAEKLAAAEKKIADIEAAKQKKQEEEAKKAKEAEEAKKPHVPKNPEDLYQQLLDAGLYKKDPNLSDADNLRNFKRDYTYSTAKNEPNYTHSPVYYAYTGTPADRYYQLLIPDQSTKTFKQLGIFGDSTTYGLDVALINQFALKYVNKEYSDIIDEVNNYGVSYPIVQVYAHDEAALGSLGVAASSMTGTVTAASFGNNTGITFDATVARTEAEGSTAGAGRVETQEVSYTIRIIVVPQEGSTEKHDWTVQQVAQAVEEWFKLQLASPSINPLTLVSIEDEYIGPTFAGAPTAKYGGLAKGLNITGKTTIQIPNVKYSTSITTTGKYYVDPNKTGTTTTIPATLKISTTNAAFIKPISGTTPTNQPTPTPAGTTNTGDDSGVNNTTSTEQADQAYESALAAMLIYVKALVEAKAPSDNAVFELDITKDTGYFYQDGALAGVISYTSKPSTDPVPFELTAYAKKGFCSALMADPNAYSVTPDVNYDKLCKAYLIPYKQAATELTIESMQFPVYITLGYLLAFLNNMCLVYDTTTATSTAANQDPTAKRPYLYIDFNPETNFCLTSPQQLSIDPTICMIPFEGTPEDYAGIYDEVVYKKIASEAFNPTTENYVSGYIPEYKTDNRYKAKMMNMLLNVDYLLNMAKSFSTSDPEHSVNLKRFLETVMVDVNKALGNFNVFRVSYRDDSNTVLIKDDQFVPSDTQDTIIEKTSYKARKTISELQLPATYTQADLTSLNYGQLPIFGAQSLARTFQFKTNMSTKLGSMIAISAQAATGSINAKDPSSLSYLNSHYEDRYKNRVVNPSNGPAQQTANTSGTPPVNNDEVAAQAFNTHIRNIYGSKFQLDAAKIEPSKNYYVERSAIFKTDNSITSGAPFIPADLEITIDGIGGIIMGQAFTIPENRMPASLRGDDNITKVGFIVGGLTHTIVNNQWLTKIKGQMIRLREDTKYGSTQVIKKLQAPTTVATGGTTPTANANIQVGPPSADDIAFYTAILTGIGAPTTPENLKFMYAWRRGESATAAWNPFNTTKTWPSATNYNCARVKNYASRQDGIDATVATLKLKYYSKIKNGLIGNIGAAKIASYIDELKTWGTGDLVAKNLAGNRLNPPAISPKTTQVKNC